MNSLKKTSPFADLQPQDVLEILWRRLHWILASTVLVAGLTAIIVAALPNRYRAETLILVDPQKVPEKYVTSTVSMDVSGRLNTITQQIMSSTRLQRIIDKYGLYRNLRGRSTQEEIIEAMRADTKVETVRNFDGAGRGLGAFRIIYMGGSPAVVAQVCAELASLFIEENLKVREEQAEGTSEFLDNQLGLAKKNLEEQEAKLREFKLQHVGELPEQAAALTATLGRLQAELQAETESLNRARQQEAFLQSMLASAGGRQAASPEMPSTPEPVLPPSPPESLERLRSQQAAVAEELEQSLLRLKPDHPDVRRITQKAQRLSEQVQREEKHWAEQAKAAPPPAAAVRPRPAASAAAAQVQEAIVMHRNQLRAVQAEIQQRQSEQARITGQIRSYQAKLDNMPIREQQIVTVMRDYEMSKAFYQSLLDKKMSADMASDLEKRQKSERFNILDPPRVPEKPFKPNRPALAGLGLIGGLGLGLLLAFAAEFRDTSIKKEEEVTVHGLRVLARIPPILSAAEASARRSTTIRRWLLGSGAVGAVLVIAAVAASFVRGRLF